MKSAKAWIALAALIIAELPQSGVIPLHGTWHGVYEVAAIVVGAFATWAVPNKPEVNHVVVSE